MEEIPDEDLMMRFQRGNTAAFDLLFDRYRRPVFSFLYRMLNRDRHCAEDLLQEVFIKLAKAAEFYRPSARFASWIFAIARNQCLNFIKSRRYLQGRRTVSLDKEGVESEAPLLDDPALRSAGPGNADLQERIEWAVASLPETYREVFILKAVEGFSHDEIAGMLERNTATVRTQYHRARLMLRKRTGPCRIPDRQEGRR